MGQVVSVRQGGGTVGQGGETVVKKVGPYDKWYQ